MGVSVFRNLMAGGLSFSQLVGGLRFLELGGREGGLSCFELGGVFSVFWKLDGGGSYFLAVSLFGRFSSPRGL